MDTFGQKLRLAREHRGLSLQAVAETLGVDHEHLRALERNDFQALPGEAIMMDCLRAYAECLRVDAELMIADYVREREECLRRLADTLPDLSGVIPSGPALSSEERRPRFKLVLAASAVVVTAAILGAWWIRSPAEPDATTQASIDKPSRAERTAAPVVPSRSVPPAAVETPPPSPEQVSKSSSPTSLDTSSLGISDFGVGTSVEGRRLVGRSNRFPEGTQVWFWTWVEGANRGDTIEHVWLRDGVEALRIPLRIGGTSWRTYSAKTLSTVGGWAVEARDDTGRVLARSEFACVP